MVDEFEHIFSDVLLRNSDLYKKILKSLANGAKEQLEIQEALNMETPGRIYEYLWELELAGFIIRDHTWELNQTGWLCF